ncbi:MAG: two-component regulator propeller domain-containing protein [Planctomycetota bacterium]
MSAAAPSVARDFEPEVYDELPFRTVEGLPSNSVQALAVGPAGYLWLGTLGGLARFDGLDFDVYSAELTEGLASDRILSLHFDDDETLWIGCEAGPLMRRVDGRFETVVSADRLQYVGQIEAAPDGTLWFAGTRLARWRDGELDVVGRGPLADAGRIGQLAFDRGGALLVATDGGLFRGDVDAFERIDARPTTAFFEDDLGAVWAVTDGARAWRVEDPDREEVEVGFRVVYGVADLSPRRSIYATDAGMWIFHRGRDTAERFSAEVMWQETDRGVRSVLPGPRGSVWLGTDRFGLRFVEPRRFERIVLPGEEYQDEVDWVHGLDRDKAIVVTQDAERAFAFEQGAEPVELQPVGDALTKIDAVTPAVDGVAWLATRGGVARYVGGRIEPHAALSAPSTTIVRAEDGTVWASQRGRLVEVREDGAPGRRTEALPEPLRGALPYPGGFLVRAGRTVLRVDTADAAVQLFHAPPAEPRALAHAEDGAVWITTYGGGLVRVHADGRSERWTSEDGLPDDHLGWVGTMVGPGGRRVVGLNSNRGLGLVSLDSLEGRARGEIEKVESWLLPTPETNGPSGCLLSGGVAALPTIEGLVLVDPERLDLGRNSPRIALEWTEVDGAPWSLDARPRGSADLAFGYTAIRFPRSADARTQYRLDGYDAGWIDAGRYRTARYTNLPPGEYTFRVRTRAADGPWSAAAVAPTVRVRALWYQDARWRAAVAFLGVALLAALYALRTGALRRRSAVLSHEIERREGSERRLRESEANYLSMLESAQDGIVMVESDGTIAFANPAMARIFGYPRDGIVGRSASWLGFPDVTSPGSAPVDDDSGTLDVRALQATWTTRTSVVERADGTPVDVLLSVAAEEHRGVTRLVGIVRDISEEQRAQRAIETLRRKLARAEETERSRIARELHDDLSQRLAALAIEMQIVLNDVEQEPRENVVHAIESVQSGLHEVSTDVHALSRQLHPTVLDDLGLSRALRSECARRERSAERSIVFVDECDGFEVRNEVGLAFFRIAQESLQNAIKHADAEKIVVRLQRIGSTLELSVTDDGVGFDEARCAADAAGGLGLASLRERARLVGAALRVRTSPGEGTTISVRVASEDPRRARTLVRA